MSLCSAAMVMWVKRSVARFNSIAAAPPVWMRALFVPVFALMALGLAGRRGWLVGVIAAAVYGGIGLTMALAPGSTVDWSRRHPVLDGALLGPLVFLALAYLTSWPLWVCAVAGVACSGMGAGRGVQRAHHRREQADK